MNIDTLFPKLKTVDGEVIRCQCGCGRPARHIHHIKPRSEGGTDHPNNLLLLSHRCHIRHHSKAGDFVRWGKLGGAITAEKMVSIPNLKQFQGEAGKARWIAYCEKKANQQMGVQ